MWDSSNLSTTMQNNNDLQDGDELGNMDQSEGLSNIDKYVLPFLIM